MKGLKRSGCKRREVCGGCKMLEVAVGCKRLEVARDRRNLVDPFMRVTSEMTRHLATLRES